MTREEALQAIKEKMDYYESDKRLRGALETLIPELAESDDERIREEIIDYLHLVGKGDGDYAQPMIDRWIAWLEKQGENKIPCLTCDEYYKGYKQGYTNGCTAGYNKAMKEKNF